MSDIEQDPVYTLSQGSIPLLVSIPHMGTEIPPDIAASMTPVASHYDDTDWHLDRLYSFVRDMGASVLQPRYSRYVIDLNRPPDGANLYPGQDTTGLLPVDTFDKEALYPDGRLPDEAEQQRRLGLYWKPYHAAIAAELARLRREHGRVLLWEAHSIRSRVPRFFEGRLPDFNFGTARDASTPPGLGQALADLVERDGRYTAVANGRFTGGYITRHYGQPAEGVYAVQLEQSQITYMQESRPYPYLPELADPAAVVVRQAVELAMEWLNKA
ncbi:N-formylglutamate deformylase [Candidimonas humi]|jgi:N-formylglutamate deformylase|uniref:N-formylglutamate deformylase n=1 Tax=Candidimonas humi TaxID=683355 RepID=A0ABV8NYQ0_9BURK|nr:N-formylglutamate deformylase [Candidimonas humi]MBV6304378.1 N-formylglutamate deformylase [Candidimonas humi]